MCIHLNAQCLQISEEVTGSLELELWVVESQCRCWKPTLGSLQEQAVLIIIELSPQLPLMAFFFFFFFLVF